jgi:sortase A
MSLAVSACGSKVDVAHLTRGASVESAGPIVISNGPAPAPAPPSGAAQQSAGPVQVGAPARPAVSAAVRPGRNAIAVIEIPKIGVRQSVYEGVSLATLHYGPGHWPGTAAFGHLGNAVIAGHRITNTRPFFDIDLLSPGDQIVLTTETARFVYEMTEHLIVGPRDTWIAQDTPEAMLTLFACHPKGSKSHRYVVRARLTSAPLPHTSAPGGGEHEESLPSDGAGAGDPAAQSSEPAPAEAPPDDAPASDCNSLLCRFGRRAAA